MRAVACNVYLCSCRNSFILRTNNKSIIYSKLLSYIYIYLYGFHCVFISATVVFVFLSVHSLTKLIMNKGSADALCGMPSAAAIATKYLLWTWQSPTENCDNSGICRKISSVTKWTPRCCGLRLIFRWNHAEPICIPRFDEAMLLSVKFLSFHINNSFVVVAWFTKKLRFFFVISRIQLAHMNIRWWIANTLTQH